MPKDPETDESGSFDSVNYKAKGGPSKEVDEWTGRKA
jgi:hypothetical protein